MAVILIKIGDTISLFEMMARQSRNGIEHHINALIFQGFDQVVEAIELLIANPCVGSGQVCPQQCAFEQVQTYNHVASVSETA